MPSKPGRGRGRKPETEQQRLRLLADQVAAARDELDREVVVARAGGLSWHKIAAATHLTAEGARKRWGRPANKRAGRLPAPPSVATSPPTSVGEPRTGTSRGVSRRDGSRPRPGPGVAQDHE